MTTQRCAFNEIVQTLDRKLALHHNGRVRFHDEIHMAVRFRTLKLGLGKRPHARENQVVTHRFDFDAVRQRIQVTHDLLEIRRGQINDGGILHVRNHQFLRVRLNESQLVVVGLPYILVVEFHAQIRDDPVLVILLVDVHCQDVVVRKRGNQFEEVHCVGADHDFVGGAFIGLKFIGVQDNADQHGVGFVEIDDFHAVFGERDGGVRQNIFERSG